MTSCSKFLGRVTTLLGAVGLVGSLALSPCPTAQAADAASTETVPVWYQQVLATLSPLQTSLVSGVQAATSWREGHLSARAARTGINRALTGLVGASRDLEHVQAVPGTEPAQRDYVAALGLYVDAFRLIAAATRLPPGKLVPQLQLSFERIRELGDITFDQGTVLLAPDLGPAVAGSDVQAASHLPDWSATGLAPGRPLAARWSGTTAEPTGTQPAPAWQAAVQGVAAPSPSSVRALVMARHPNASRCRRLAVALNGAEVALSSVPGSAADAQASALLRISLLVEAEAALTTEARTFSPIGSSRTLSGVATSLASIGAQLRAGV